MKSLNVKKLEVGAFAPYGSFASMINPNTIRIGEEPVEFFRDMAQLDLGGSTIASLSVCRVLKRPLVVDVSEFHNACGEGILPLDADILIHVAPASPEPELQPEGIEIFRVPKGTLVCLRPGVWHHAPFVVDASVANTLIILPERTYARDCHVFQIPEEKKIQIKA
jgi:ureidoglycolate lyase